MKKYAQFFRGDHPLLGSDSILQLDGRYGVSRCINEIIPHIKRLNHNMDSKITKFEIREYSDSGSNKFNVYCLVYTGII